MIKKFDIGECTFQSDHLSEIVASGLVESEGVWLKGYKPHGTNLDAPLGEILFRDDAHTVPAYLLYGKQNFKNKYGLYGSEKNPWLLTLGTLIDGISQLKVKDFKKYFKFVLNQSSDTDNSDLIQYCIFGDKVFSSNGEITSFYEVKKKKG
tara:strand:+ start:590 stop:1042 length:453 start_codon:yes stop_codon:yes gene_type:complete